MKKLKLQLLSSMLIFTIIFVSNSTMAQSFYTLHYPESALEVDYDSYSIIKDDMDIEPQAISPVLVFIGGAIVGGIIWDGIKWFISDVYNEGLEGALNKAIFDINRFAPQNVPGRTGEITEVTITSSGKVERFYDSNGCVLAPGGMTWNCPYRYNE